MRLIIGAVAFLVAAKVIGKPKDIINCVMIGGLTGLALDLVDILH